MLIRISRQTDEAAAAAAAGGPATPQFKSHAVRIRSVTTEPDLVQRSEAFRCAGRPHISLSFFTMTRILLFCQKTFALMSRCTFELFV